VKTGQEMLTFIRTPASSVVNYYNGNKENSLEWGGRTAG
jgi:hypothetical protein